MSDRFFIYKKLPRQDNGEHKNQNDLFECYASQGENRPEAVEYALKTWPTHFKVGDWLMVFPGPVWFKVFAAGLKGVELPESDFLKETA